MLAKPFVIYIATLVSTIFLMIFSGSKKQIIGSDEHEYIKNIAQILLLIISIFFIQNILENSHEVIKSNWSLVPYIFLTVISFLSYLLLAKEKIFIKTDIFCVASFLILLNAFGFILSESSIVKIVCGLGWFLSFAVLSLSGGVNLAGLNIAVRIIVASTIFFILSLLRMIIDGEGEIFDLVNLGPIWILVGIAPFQLAHVNFLERAPLSAAFMLQAQALVLGAWEMQSINVVNQKSMIFLIVLLLLANIISLLRSLYQNRVKKSLSFLVSCSMPVILLAVKTAHSSRFSDETFFVLIISFAICSFFIIFYSLAFIKEININSCSWEVISGYGKVNSWQSLTLLIGVASLCGLPGTMGYLLKLSLIKDLGFSVPAMIAVFLSIALGGILTMRLFVFLFSKESLRQDFKEESNFSYLLFLCCFLIVAIGFFPFS